MAKLDSLLTRMNGSESQNQALTASLMRMVTDSLDRQKEEVSNRQVRDAISSELTDLATALGKAIKGLDQNESFSGLKSQLTGLQSKLDRLDKKLSERTDQAVLAAINAVSEDVKAAVGRISIPETDLEPLREAIASIPAPDTSKETDRILAALSERRESEEWVFEIEREDFSDRIKTVTARKA